MPPRSPRSGSYTWAEAAEQVPGGRGEGIRCMNPRESMQLSVNIINEIENKGTGHCILRIKLIQVN